MKKRLVYITNSRIPTQRAHGLQISKMCEAFAHSGVDLTLVVPKVYNEIKSNPFEYYGLNKNFKIQELFSIDFSARFNPLPKAFYLIKTISFALSTFFFVLFKTRRDDFIYFRYDNTTLLALWPFFGRRNIVCEAHFLISGWERKLMLKARNVVVITSHSKEIYDKQLDFEDKVILAPDGVTISDFDLMISKDEARQKLGLPQDKKLVVYTGYFYKWKGVDPLIRAAKNFQPDEELVLVGGAGDDIERIRKIIREENIKNIRILGYRPYKEIPLYQKAADCLVLTSSLRHDQSKFYTSPLKLFEYMASARPIVASDTPSVREVLDEESAVMVIPDDEESMFKSIREVLDNKKVSEDMAAKAKMKVVGYDWKIRAKKILEFIEKTEEKVKVLYLFAGERRAFIDKFKKGQVSGTQLIGINSLNKFGIRPDYLENWPMNRLRRLNFHLAPWPALFVLPKYDVLFVASNLFFVFFVKKILRLKRPKIVFYNTFLTNTLKRNEKGLTRYIINKAIKSADVILCPSTSQKKFLVEKGFDENKIVFVPTGVDEKFFRPSDTAPKQFALAVGKDNGRDYRTLMDAAKGYKGEVVLICSGRNLVGIEEIPSNVKVLFDQSQTEMMKYMREALFLVLPTHKEDSHLDASDCSGQYVLLESMAMGKAVIASYRSTLSDYLTEKKNGMIVPAEDPASLRKAMEYLSSHRTEAEEMGKAARQFIETTCGMDIYAKSLSEIFIKLAKET